MRRIIVSLGVVGATLFSGAVAQAAPTAAQQRAANARVARAERAGPAALRHLAAQVMKQPAHAASVAAVGPSNQTQALAVALYDAGSSTAVTAPVAPPNPSAALPPVGSAPTLVQANRASPIAHAASCWGPVKSYWVHTIAGGANVASLTETNPSWCGNGSSISFGFNNWDHQTWSNYPYCLTNVSNHQGWDQHPAWAHGGLWGTTGVYSLAIVCIPILGSEHVTLRVAANGYWDRYDDFGF